MVRIFEYDARTRPHEDRTGWEESEVYPHVAQGVRERITGRFDSRTEASNSEMSRIDSVRLCIVVVSGGVERARFIFWMREERRYVRTSVLEDIRQSLHRLWRRRRRDFDVQTIFWEMLDVSRRRSWRKQTCIQHLLRVRSRV